MVMEDAHQILQGHVSKKAEKSDFFIKIFAFHYKGHTDPLKKIWKIQNDRIKAYNYP